MKTYIGLGIILSLKCSFIFFGCSNQITNDSTSDIGYTDTSSTVGVSTSKNMPTSNANLTEMYSRAIDDYIQLVNKEFKIHFDTLVFGKHVYGQPDDFPDVSLPNSIGKVHIKLISPEQALETRDSLAFINMIGDVHTETADFIFVTFLNGFSHSFDCFISYKYIADKNEFDLVYSRFETFDNGDIKAAANN